MNTLLNALQNETNRTFTENGAATLKSTLKHTVDFFGLGGALRTRSASDIVSLFSKAFAEDALTAVKTLFYFRDIRGGQGERNTFRVCLNWLANEQPHIVGKNAANIVEYGRWDDLFSLKDTRLWHTLALPMIKAEWYKEGKASLFWKWMPSNNTSREKTRKVAEEIRAFLNISPKTYRKTLSAKRAELDVVERKMCASNWSEINYKGVPSKAALNYTNAFRKHDSFRYESYLADVESGKTTINASTLYPYDIYEKRGTNEKTLDLLWKALPNYMENDTSNGIVVADVSGSMSGRPMAVSISLAVYIAEKNKGAFANHFITFSDTPKLQKVVGNNIREKFQNLERADWGMSTNLEAVFDLILRTAVKNKVPASDLPSKVYIVSDMEFNVACRNPNATLFEAIKLAYEEAGYEVPELVFWNVNAKSSKSPIRFDERGTCLVSGCSPSILTSLLSGEITTPEDIMLRTINSERYAAVVI